MSAKDKWNDNLPSTKEWQDRTRAKIASSKVLETALQAANGEIELSTSRASIVKTLLDRVLPAQTQSQVDQTVHETKPDFASLREMIKNSPEFQKQLRALLDDKPTLTVVGSDVR